MRWAGRSSSGRWVEEGGRPEEDATGGDPASAGGGTAQSVVSHLMDPSETTVPMAQSVVRAIRILECFTRASGPLGTAEISAALGVNRATTHRLCRTLDELGFLVKDEQKARYRLGLRAVALAESATYELDVAEIAGPILMRLVSKTSTTANVARLDGSAVVLVARVPAPALVGVRLDVGSRIPVHASSMGQAICAFLPPCDRDQVLDSLDYLKLTSETLSSRQALDRQLDVVAEQGFAVSCGSYTEGVSGIALPIFDHRSVPVAAINVAVAGVPDPEELAARYLEDLRGAASEMSSLLAYDGDELFTRDRTTR